MTTTSNAVDHHDDHHHEHEAHMAEIGNFGFWLYILSDCLLFATLFATFAVMSQSFAGAITPGELIDINLLAVQTAALLLSSFTFGVAMLAAHKKNMFQLWLWLVITGLLGLAFLAMEIYEFQHFAHEGATPQASGYWSSFFALVGTHGLHVTAGLFWMVVLFFHFRRDGFSSSNMQRLSYLSLFWHFLDIIWICVFSFVYLRGLM